MKRDKVWYEYNIHGDDVHDEGFNLFEPDPEDKYEILEWNFDGLPTITLRGNAEDYTNSTGMTVWAGAELLAEYLLRNRQLVKKKKCLEIGSGLGLCGIIAFHLGADTVCLSDGDITVLENLRFNIQNLCQEQEGAIHCPQLIWGQDLQEFQNEYGVQDIIFATDCGYITKSLIPMFETVYTLLNPDGGIFLFVNKCSSQASMDFILEKAKECGLEMYDRGSTEKENNTEDEHIYTFRRKRTILEDKEWREYHINGDDVHDEAFNLFASPEEKYQMLEWNYPNVPTIRLRGNADDYTNSTGMTIWTGAEVMCDFLIENIELFKGKKVLELGCGLGLVSILAFHLGAKSVCITDGDIDVMRNLRFNIEESRADFRHRGKNSLQISCPQLIWGKDVDKFQEAYGKFDVIIAADCSYITKSIMPMFETINKLLEPETGRLFFNHVSSSLTDMEYMLESADKCNLDLVSAKEYETGDEDGVNFDRPKCVRVFKLRET